MVTAQTAITRRNCFSSKANSSLRVRFSTNMWSETLAKVTKVKDSVDCSRGAAAAKPQQHSEQFSVEDRSKICGPTDYHYEFDTVEP